MKCLVCDCLFPSNYAKCPVCGNHAIEKEKYAKQIIEVEEKEVIYAEVVGSDFSLGEANGD